MEMSSDAQSRVAPVTMDPRDILAMAWMAKTNAKRLLETLRHRHNKQGNTTTQCENRWGYNTYSRVVTQFTVPLALPTHARTSAWSSHTTLPTARLPHSRLLEHV
jgi:hypothetical protein